MTVRQVDSLTSMDLVEIEPVQLQMTFDYSEYSEEASTSLQRHAANIRGIVIRATDDVARELYEAKQEIHREKKDGWAKWVETEIGWTVQYADRLIKRYEYQNSETQVQNAIEQPVESVQEGQEVRKIRTTNEEKRKTVEDFLAETPNWQEMSYRAIARICGVDDKTVAAIIKDLFPEPEPEPVIEADPEPEKEEEPTEPEPEPLQPLVESTAPVDNMPPPVENPLTPEPEPTPESEPEIEPPQELAPENKEETKEEKEEPRSSGVPAALLSSESNEWYTPKIYIDAAHKLMGGIDLDPASCEVANKTVKAAEFYDISRNGLNQSWTGRVWLNPPYGKENGKSNQETWTKKLIGEIELGHVKEAILLVNASTGASWFQPLWDYLICFTDHRIRFYNADSDQPTKENALVYFGTQRKRFIELFSRFGTVIERAKA